MEYMSTGFVRTLLHSKLLTDDDRILVEDALTDSAVKFPSNQRFFTFLIGFFAVLVGVVFWAEQNDNLLLYNITIGVSIAFTFIICVGLFPLLLVPLTRYGIRSWNNSDRTVHLFLAGLKRRETYIYG
ncbi:unnamed protein product [Bursaphelenchus xylophilus]|uniref:(pine wood nematode) hypothetical protein n=1 Tax=Bursaphelenchus xylophilus TaxID=6326 RepID=A0A1I7RUM2_BURXY|nr:unnamed protein product [Bursaphelenchus xylophilus]CAG9114218.1 unnamed protein product [Bursaphelenchus xylophilus]